MAHPQEDDINESPEGDFRIISPVTESVVSLESLITTVKTEIVRTVKSELATFKQAISEISKSLSVVKEEVLQIRKQQGQQEDKMSTSTCLNSESRISALHRKSNHARRSAPQVF